LREKKCGAQSAANQQRVKEAKRKYHATAQRRNVKAVVMATWTGIRRFCLARIAKVISNNEPTKSIVHEKHERHEQDMLLFVPFVSFVDSIFFYGSGSSWEALSQESP